MRENKLNEEESDIGSVPSQYFIKGNSESTSGSPVGVPKIVVTSNEAVSNIDSTTGTIIDEEGEVKRHSTVIPN
jgi:hypothetical protein